MLSIAVSFQTTVISWLMSLQRRDNVDERGQATAEYALVLLGAAAVALLVVAWATKTNRVGKLLDLVLETVMHKAR